MSEVVVVLVERSASRCEAVVRLDLKHSAPALEDLDLGGNESLLTSADGPP